jgi:hypothetical protein
MPRYQKELVRLPQQPLYEHEHEELESREPSHTSVASDDDSPIRPTSSRVGPSLRAHIMSIQQQPGRIFCRRLTQSPGCRVMIRSGRMTTTAGTRRRPTALPPSAAYGGAREEEAQCNSQTSSSPSPSLHRSHCSRSLKRNLMRRPCRCRSRRAGSSADHRW